MRALAAAAIALLLFGCDRGDAPAPAPSAEVAQARPALWEVTAPGGATAWLFGTIHALEHPVQWRSPAIDRALAGADRIVVEVAELEGSGTAETFTRLSRGPGLPPLSERMPPAARPALDKALAKSRMSDAHFRDVETWAAALMLVRAGDPALKPENGIDRAVLRIAGKRPVVELEGAHSQLSIFDTLPEKEQRDLLTLVVSDASGSGDESPALAKAWRTGDMTAIEAETRRDLLADPELRAALFTGRNRAWTARIADMIHKGQRPFVAVGAAHMAGPEGLPAMLAARGLTVKRVQ